MTKLHRRRHPRQTTNARIWVYDGPNQVAATLLDVSTSGMKLDLHDGDIASDRFSVFLSADQPLFLCRIQWRDGSVCGVQLI